MYIILTYFDYYSTYCPIRQHLHFIFGLVHFERSNERFNVLTFFTYPFQCATFNTTPPQSFCHLRCAPGHAWAPSTHASFCARKSCVQYGVGAVTPLHTSDA